MSASLLRTLAPIGIGALGGLAVGAVIMASVRPPAPPTPPQGDPVQPWPPKPANDTEYAAWLADRREEHASDGGVQFWQSEPIDTAQLAADLVAQYDTNGDGIISTSSSAWGDGPSHEFIRDGIATGTPHEMLRKSMSVENLVLLADAAGNIDFGADADEIQHVLDVNFDHGRDGAIAGNHKLEGPEIFAYDQSPLRERVDDMTFVNDDSEDFWQPDTIQPILRFGY